MTDMTIQGALVMAPLLARKCMSVGVFFWGGEQCDQKKNAKCL